MEKHSTKMRLAPDKWKTDWQALISIILSARTRDEVTIPVAKGLFEKYPNEKKLAKAKVKDVEKKVRPVNFYRNKSKNIINCSKELVKRYDCKTPETIDELVTLPGVGRKTANVFVSKKGNAALAVDTHVAYISQKLGWTKNKNAEKIEHDLKDLFSRRNWGKVNKRLVRFGKTHTSKKKKDKLIEEIKKIK